MLGLLGLWSSSKGMVLVPNLSGLTQAQAISAIQAAGLTAPVIANTATTSDSNLSNKVALQTPASGTLVDYETTVNLSIYNYVAATTTTTTTFGGGDPTPPPPPPSTTTTTTVAPPYPNIGTVFAYGAGPGQAWTSNQAYITWGGSGWGSYTVVAGNGSSSNSPTSAGGPPVLLSGFSPSTSYSVTVTLYAGANYTGALASSSTTFTTAASAATTTTTTTVVPATTTTTTTAVVPATTTTTAAPSTFIINSISSGVSSITYSWSNSPAGTAYYDVYYSDGDSISASTTTGSTSKTFSGLVPNTKYTVFVIARNSSNQYLASTNSDISTQAIAATTTTTVAPTAVPSGGSATLSGSSTPGSVITASTSGWSGSPTSYSIKITTALSPNIPTFNDNAVASGTTSATYTITSADAQSPVNIFKAFATATNAGGTSTPASSGSIYATPPAATTTTTVAPVVTTTTTTAPVSSNTWYACCMSGDPMSVNASSQAQATSLINNLCQSETGTSISGSPSQNPVSCNTPTAAPATTTVAPAPATTTVAPAPATTTVAPAPATTTAAPVATTAAPTGYTTCTSQNVTRGLCVSTGCDSNGCGTGSACSTNAQQRCSFE